MSDALRRKLGASRAPKKPGAVSVEALLRKTMPRDADAVLSMELVVAGIVAQTQDKSIVLEQIGSNDLVFLVETEDGAHGLAILDPALVASVIEVQVGGRVSDRPIGDRKPTRTDGIVVAEIVAQWLISSERAMTDAGLETTWPLTGFEFAPGNLTRREADLLLEPVEFRTLRIELSLGGGARTGTIRFAAPRRIALLEGRENTTAAKVRGHLPGLPVELRAVLARIPYAISRTRGLKADDLIPLPAGCLQKVQLETRAGRLIREVQLGQLDGKKAVRLSDMVASKGGARAVLPMPPGSHVRDDAPETTDAPTPVLDVDAPVDDLPPPVTANDLADLPPPELPDVPVGTDGLPGLPDLPDLPELPELPDLPDLPDLP